MEYEDVEEPCCGNCAKLTECFGVDVDIEDPYEIYSITASHIKK